MAKSVPTVEKNLATDGDRPMSLVRRMGRERERMLGMTDEERAWRKKWLKAQELDPDEPMIPKGYHKEMYNPIRRFYLPILNNFQNMLVPIMGQSGAHVTRHLITKTTMTIMGMYWLWYHLKYNKMDWTRKGGWKITVTRNKMFPDNKDMSLLNKVQGNQFYVNNFDKSPI